MGFDEAEELIASVHEAVAPYADRVVADLGLVRVAVEAAIGQPCEVRVDATGIVVTSPFVDYRFPFG